MDPTWGDCRVLEVSDVKWMISVQLALVPGGLTRLQRGGNPRGVTGKPVLGLSSHLCVSDGAQIEHTLHQAPLREDSSKIWI